MDDKAMERAGKIFDKYGRHPSRATFAAAIREAERVAVDNFKCEYYPDKPCDYGIGYAEGFKAAQEMAAKIFIPAPYPDCTIQMTYQEAFDEIRAIRPKEKNG